MKNRKFVRVLAFVLASVMVLGMLPLNVLATESDFTSETHDRFSTTTSTIAPGVTQSINYAYAKADGKQMVYYVATADITRDDVIVQSSYLNAQATVFGMSKLREQMAAADKKFSDPDNAEFISEYYTAVAGVNGDFYNMTTGQPSGAFVLNGVMSSNKANNRPWFAIFEDGTALCGANNTDWDAAVKAHGAAQQAVGGSQVLVKDGKDVTASASGSYNTDRHSRTCVGITADGKVVMMTLDGRQEPFSCGGTMHELAQIMLEQGCVMAINLDGGGSATFAARQEGENEVSIVNRPSDGSERSISSGLIIASLAAPSNIFDRASLKAENEYVTPGSIVNVTATGVSPAGTAAVIPDNAVWQMADATMGTVVDGTFTASDKTGAAVIQMAVDGKVVGETIVNVVIPDKLEFNSAVITVPYTKTVKLGLTATFGLNKVTLKASDITFELSNSAVGTLDGFNFTACEENEAITESSLKATLKFDAAVTATSTINLGKGSEVIADFENGTLPDSYKIATGYPQYGPAGANGQNEVGKLYIVNSENGQVHDGNYAMAVECDFSQAYETGYHLLNLTGLNLKVPAKAQTIGMWLYLPELEELYTTSMRFNGATSSGAGVSSPWLWDNCQPYGWDNDGWRYVTMDISGYPEDITFNTIQFYICDRDNEAVDFWFKDHASVNGKFTYYIDNITIDYSSAVDDREPPVFTSVRYADESMSDAVELNGQKVSANKISFGAVVHENTNKDNYTGLDDSSIKAYVDGVAVDFTYSGGTISIADCVLADGVHTIRFEAADMMGNKSYVERQIIVSGGADIPTVAVVPQNPSANKILIGSLYWVNLEATSAKDVETVTVDFNLNSMSQWELDHMIATPGFKAEYTYDEVNNNATITVTKVGKVAEDATVLVQIPIRTWESRLTEYKGYEDQTPAKLWSRKIIWPVDIKLSADYGAITFVDGSKGSFSMAPISVITELYGNYGELNANGDYANKTSWHIHTATAIADKAATCTESGYTNRTFCSVCNSVVDWGTTIEANGHTYEVADGVLKCACGELFNGVYTDGKTYVDGVVVADGWHGESYYKNGVLLTGLQLIDGYYYDFGKDGVCQGKAKLDGFYYDETAEAYRHFTAGNLDIGDVAIYPTVYFFDENGYAISGDVTIGGYTCTFDEKGAFASSSNASVVDAGFCGTNINYVLLSDGTLKVGGEGVMKDYTANGLYPAWIIKNDMNKVTSIEIGNGITKIGKFAFFRNGYVRSVTFEENSSLKTIGWGGFGHCWRLAEVTIPASVETLEEYAFYECGALKSFNVEDGSKLKTIKDYAFQHDIGLETVYIPDSTVNFGIAVFYKAKADVVLQVVENSAAHNYANTYGLNVELRNGMLLPIASGNCTDTISWTLYPDGELALTGSGAMTNYTAYTQQPWASYRHMIKKITIGKDITAVGNYAFAYAQNVTAITFEEGSKLTSVGVLSFFNNPKVTEVILPETVTSLGAYAFGDCFALVNVYVPQGTNYIYYTAFTNSKKVVLSVSKGTYAEEYAIKQGINYTAREFVYDAVAGGKLSDTIEWARYENGELWITGTGAMPNFASHKDQPWYTTNHLIKKIIIGKDITAIGNYAFCYAQNVTEIVFEEGSKLTSVGVLSFFNVPKVTEVILPETVTSLGAYAFGDCFALVNVYVPQGVNYIYYTAFTNSAKVVLDVSKGTYAEEYAIKQGINYTAREFVYDAVAGGKLTDTIEWARYENGELWITGTGAMPNFASHKDQPWYTTNHLIKKIIIGKDITAIGNYAFCYAQNVTEIVFEEGSKLTSIGVLSFFNVPKVTEITFPETVTYVGAYAFGDCFALVNVIVPENTDNIYHTAFANSKNVVLNVVAGSWAEDFAKAYGINYVIG